MSIATTAPLFIQDLPDGPLALPAQEDAHNAVWQLLETVTDPEIPVLSLREIGVLRAVRAGSDGLQVFITPTYNGCPAMEQMQDDVRQCLETAGLQAEVITCLSPAWSSDWMTAEAKDKLRAYGIAPPHSKPLNSDHSLVQWMKPASLLKVACPQCGSDNTTETSHFGSTACKAMYTCLVCMEPFDYFKPY